MAAAVPDNPDRAVLAELIAAGGTGGRDIAMTSSPLLCSLGAAIRGISDDSIVIAYSTGPDHLQGQGVVAGGVICVMLDFALAFSALGRLPPGDGLASIDLQAGFIAPLRQGQALATGHVLRMGARLVHAEARLQDGEGRLVARASSALAITRHDSNRTIGIN